MYEPISAIRAARRRPLTFSACAALLTLPGLAGLPAAADDGGLVEVLVSGDRLPIGIGGQSVVRLDTDDLDTRRLDVALARLPGVGLFRRADSLTANPTIQGLNMRGIGANAAGRVLVTLDGVPLNDPFGGWLYWSALAGNTLDGAAVLKGGSAGAFGPQALAGAVALTSTRPETSGARARIAYGRFDTVEIMAGADMAGERGFLSIDGQFFETDGPFIVDEDTRGPIDARAASEVQSLSLRGGTRLGDHTLVKGRLAYFEEERINGLDAAPNSTEAIDASFSIIHDPVDGAAYEVVAYYRDRTFENTFASVRDNRTTARPVLDQTDVPGWGAGLLARVRLNDIEFGVDGRRLSGETNERFRNLGDGFTRSRVAGGDQWIVGGFAGIDRAFPWGSVSANVRLDRFRTYNGARVERNLADGSVVREDTVPARGDWQWSARIGGSYGLTGALDMRAGAYRSWRLPTINEFYRPFRVVNDITEANALLEPEKLYGIEAGLDYEPLNTLRVSVTAFRNWLRDGVGNVTIGFGPGFFPLGGFVPDGGVLRQRANIAESITDGVELDAGLDLAPGWSLEGRYLYARARVTDFPGNPDLEGLRPVQTPRHSLSLMARRQARWGWLEGEVRHRSSQFDDDLNTRRLPAITTVHVRASVPVGETLTVRFDADNLLGERVVSAISGTGLETIAQPAFWRVGLEAAF
ncbi:TonB-dependent receptor [Eilatimonas milleporae]|uniref:Outer membrane receptor protein involved in Fe transport n=1 Tax=Eilatimonas milleporae TaxID=911205 RepID=A0A3M0BYD0_9PROT|nr:TonB-dependent receptor [Eilatimonas milleporae]RMB02624.1 outer membrane receptor protein involved in Fe transport [Eilatimonas milleporae]